MSLLGIDIGTSKVKAVAFRAHTGETLAAASSGYGAAYPAPGRMELDTELVWRAFIETVRRIATHPTVSHDPVTALAFSASCDEVIPVDADGRPLGPCIMAPDARGTDVLETLRTALPEDEVYRRTGLAVAPIHPLARILWYRRHDRALFDTATGWLGWAELVLARIGFPPTTDETTAARWLAWDMIAGEWWPDALATAGLDQRALPIVAKPATPVGGLAREAAELTGLPAGTLVVTGAFDQICAAIGAGLTDPGDCVVGTGSWENTTIVLDGPLGLPARDRGITWGPYAENRKAALVMNAGGVSAVRWFVDQFARDVVAGSRAKGADPYAEALRLASARPAHALFLPHLQGSLAPWRDPDATGAFVGLTLATTREEMLRAVLEGITFELRANLEPIPGGPALRDPIRNTGGGSRSPEWVQLKADVLERPIAIVAADEPGCLGAAILAGVGSGTFTDVASTQARFCRVERVVEPDRRRSPLYAERYATYRSLYPALRFWAAGS